ncbi:MAG: hypothetical protein OXD46_03525 [Chloroflexi bacterium]|nr:hypothetical protein [Chloroflexota bacterium]
MEIDNSRVVDERTATERYEASIAEIATGPWSGRFMTRLGYGLQLEATRHEMLLIRRLEDRLLFHPGGGNMANPPHFRPEGSDLTLVGNCKGEDVPDPDNYSPTIHADRLEDVWWRLARRIPDIADGELFTGYAGLSFKLTPADRYLRSAGDTVR